MNSNFTHLCRYGMLEGSIGSPQSSINKIDFAQCGTGQSELAKSLQEEWHCANDSPFGPIGT